MLENVKVCTAALAVTLVGSKQAPNKGMRVRRCPKGGESWLEAVLQAALGLWGAADAQVQDWGGRIPGGGETLEAGKSRKTDGFLLHACGPSWGG